MAKIIIDPISRIEGHLSIEIDVNAGKITDARCKGDMFRGFEILLKGKNPVDANMITQRICGVCPISHAIASSRCLESAFNISPSKNGALLRNLTLAANYLQSHIIHFYHLAALDYVDIKAILHYNGNDEKLKNLRLWAENELQKKKGDDITVLSPFLPRYEGKGFYIKNSELNIHLISSYIKALNMRMKAHKMVAIFGGKIPHAASILPGGVSQKATMERLKEYKNLLEEIEEFVKDIYVQDVIEVTKAFPNYFSLGKSNSFLSYGVFGDELNSKYLFDSGVVVNRNLEKFNSSLIEEYVKYSHYKSKSGLHPSNGQTVPDLNNRNAYSWVKSPRYNGLPLEVGPLARIAISYFSGNSIVKQEVNAFLKKIKKPESSLFSVLGRHAARVLECIIICKQAKIWLDQVEVGAPSRTHYEIPAQGNGMGLAEAPRGALGHWITIDNYLIDNYQCVVPTTWNIGPRDDKGNMGVIEQALINTPISDINNPIEAARVVRSFDPCLACAIHVMEGKRIISKFKI